jgi:hypothetical protein
MKMFTSNRYVGKFNHAIIAGAITLSVLSVGCQKDDSSNSTSSVTQNGNMIINNNQSELNERVELKNEVLTVQPLYDYSTQSSKEVPEVDPTKNYVFRLKAEVAAPVYNGDTLQATHVKIYDKYAFVTYNTKGDKYLGGIDIFDVSDISNPTIVRQFIFNDEDISSVDYYNNKLYIVGALDVDADTLYNYIERPAVLEILSLNSGYDASIDTLLNLSSYVGTDVCVTSDYIYALSGTDGYLKIFDHSLNNVFSKSITDARSVKVNSSNIFVLQGDPAQIIKICRSSNTETANWSVYNDALQSGAKSGLAVNDSYVFGALNLGGLKMYTTDGTLKQSLAKPTTPEGELDANFVTNNVSLNEDLVLIANGEAGLYLGGLVESMNDSLFVLGKIQFDGSVNFVESKDSVIFVATGKGGLKILSVSIDNGLPSTIIETKPCSTLVSRIIDLFPERVNNYKTYKNTLFGDTYQKQIVLTKESEVYVTFLYENAGWKNSFGYYTYNESSPPTCVSQLTKHVLFPNVSMTGEGGALNSGDMVQVGTGTFPAGTVIGFYLVCQGWCCGGMVDGIYTHYTDYQFNLGGYQQHTLFKEKNCGDIAMVFEDISMARPLSYTDNDFNDIMFVISDSSNPDKVTSSFDLTNVPEF